MIRWIRPLKVSSVKSAPKGLSFDLDVYLKLHLDPHTWGLFVFLSSWYLISPSFGLYLTLIFNERHVHSFSFVYMKVCNHKRKKKSMNHVIQPPSIIFKFFKYFKQCCPIELSAVMTLFCCIFSMMATSHMWVLTLWNVANIIKDQILKCNLILIKFK